MSKPLALSKIMAQFRQRWQQLPDGRKPNNNTKYRIVDAMLAAFSTFFVQMPSFLAYQRTMAQSKGRSNAQSLFAVERIPSDNQIRNLLDPLQPAQFHGEYAWVLDELEQSGQLEHFRGHEKTLLVALDGLTYHSSTTIHCAECSVRQDSQGTLHYYHSAVTPVIVQPDSPQVLPLPPEFIVPQDGTEKQDCERAAAKRWLVRHQQRYPPQTLTLLGDDLYANQPLCQLIAQLHQQFFVFVCKPDSHVTLYQELALLDKVAGVTTQQVRYWTGRQAEIWTYRFANQVPLRAGADALPVNWFELTITHEKTGQLLFHNSWITNHLLCAQTVAPLARSGRTRWKVENETINVLKNHGYHLEHNFGHGHAHLANVLFTLNLLAFLTHTAQHLLNDAYRLLRDTLAVRRTFFNDLKALTRYLLFASWDDLFAFMLDGLELSLPPP
jgi:hypothetical protein